MAKTKRKITENQESDLENTQDLLNCINLDEINDSSDDEGSIESSGESWIIEEVEENQNDQLIDEKNNDSGNEQESYIEEVAPSSSKNSVNEKKKIKNRKSKTKQKNRNLEENSSVNKILENSGIVKNKDEYEEDSSDEEDIRNTIGNIPVQWYEDYSHLGYDWDGKKILKPKQGDRIDEFLQRVDDPEFWKTVFDPYTNQKVVLSDEDIQLIHRIQAQKIPDTTYDEYAPWIEWFTSEVMKMPLRKFPEHKRSFLPSKHEEKKVAKLVRALKMGWIKTKEEEEKEKAKKEPQFYMLWSTDDTPEQMRRITKHIPAPKRPLPGHAESYNPPSEFLFDKKELKDWNKLKDEPWKRKLQYIPQKYPSLREVPAYSEFIKERFQRCLDLYLCPRAIKMRLNIDPEDLVPKLPSPRDLQPFPTVESMVYKGHTDMIRTISVETKGQYIASGSDDFTVKVWEISTGRCLKTFEFSDVVRSIQWCPSQALSLIAVASSNRVDLINPGVGDKLVVSKTDSLLVEIPNSDTIIEDRVKTAVQWEHYTSTSPEWLKSYRIALTHFKSVTQVTWHRNGDYFATLMPDGQNRSILVSQLSKRRSQLPFTKSKGLVQCVQFHPFKPFLFVATQRNVRIYDLVKLQLIKKLMSNSQWISSISIHPGGDNVLVGTYDRKMLWFDLDLSTKPYQTLRLHNTAVRSVAYHKRYPLFASASDDNSVIVSHGMVYNDLLKNPLIVPLKKLSTHKSNNDFGVFCCEFHPIQPWIFSSGSDSTIRLYT